MFKKEKLAEFIKEKKISYEKFGERIGVTGKMVEYLAKGFKQPSVGTLRRIADELGCTMDELVES